MENPSSFMKPQYSQYPKAQKPPLGTTVPEGAKNHFPGKPLSLEFPPPRGLQL